MIIREIDFRLASRLDELEPLLDAIDFFIKVNAVSPTPAYRLQLAVDEFVANVIEHGYTEGMQGEIQVRVRLDDGMLELICSDDGRPFDPSQVPTPDLTGSVEERRVGGLGIHLVRTFAVSANYHHENGRNVFNMRFTLAEPAA